jgi:hypothetical protein
MTAEAPDVNRMICNRRLLPLLLLALASCAAPRGPLVVTDRDPSIKIPAIQKAVREKDRSVIPQLIQELNNDDAAVRLYANHALEELTGERFGYKYFQDEAAREPAIQRWRQWLNEQQAKGNKHGSSSSAIITRATSGPS